MADCTPSEESPGNDTIKSTSNLVPYVEYLKSHLFLLGAVLNIDAETAAIVNDSGDPTSKCLRILHHWLQVTPDPTWNEFCSALQSDNTFNRARNQIEKNHCKHRKVPAAADVRSKSNSTFSLKWMVIFLLIPVMVSCSSYYGYQHYWLHSEQSIQVTTVSPPPYNTEGVSEAIADPNQSQSEPHIVPTQVPTPTKSPPQSGSSLKEESVVKDSQMETIKAKPTNFNRLPPHQLTNDELSQLQRVEIKEEGRVWILLGVTGAGKSCLGNFVFGQDDLFLESEIPAKSKTQNSSIECTTFDGEQLCVIDTPGLVDTQLLGKHKSKAVDIAEDTSHLITELTKMMLMTKQGISAFLIVVPLHHRDYAGLQQFLDFFDILGSYWDHSVVVFSHPKHYGSTEDAQYKAINSLFDDPECPPILTTLKEKVNNRFIIAEAKEWRSDTAYRHRVVGKIRTFSDAITKQHGRYQDNLQSIGNKALEKAKLQLRHNFEDLESPEAKAAIFQSTFKHVREVVYKLVKIKLADGEDVDKLKEMAAVKEKELSDIRKQRDLLHQEFLEEEKRRKKAEEEQRRLAEAKRMEEERRKKAEEEQRREAQRRAEAEKEQRREAQRRAEAEKEQRREAQRRAEAEKEQRREAQRRAEAEKEQRREAQRRAEAEKEQRREAQRRAEAEKEQRREAQRRAEAEKEQRREAQRRAKAEADKLIAEKQAKAAEDALARERSRGGRGQKLTDRIADVFGW